jgi:hypothetical protein
MCHNGKADAEQIYCVSDQLTRNAGMGTWKAWQQTECAHMRVQVG